MVVGSCQQGLAKELAGFGPGGGISTYFLAPSVKGCPAWDGLLFWGWIRP